VYIFDRCRWIQFSALFRWRVAKNSPGLLLHKKQQKHEIATFDGYPPIPNSGETAAKNWDQKLTNYSIC